MSESMSRIVAKQFCGDGKYHSAHDIIKAYYMATGVAIDRVQARGIKQHIISASMYDTSIKVDHIEKLIMVNDIVKRGGRKSQDSKLDSFNRLINSVFRG